MDAQVKPATTASLDIISRAAQREAFSAFTRVHSPSKTGVNALEDALWRNGALQTRIVRVCGGPGLYVGAASLY